MFAGKRIILFCEIVKHVAVVKDALGWIRAFTWFVWGGTVDLASRFLLLCRSNARSSRFRFVVGRWSFNRFTVNRWNFHRWNWFGRRWRNSQKSVRKLRR
jgi:hypothetical protein